ncbi:winged helix-turn-helix domain-containing protein [Brevibacillus halotolerans]
MRRNGVEIELTKKEFDIIELLATNPGQVFSKEQIFEKIWGYDSDRMSRR